MEENKFTNEENVTVDTEEVNADAVVEEIAEEAEAAVEEIAEEAEAAVEETAEEAEAAAEEADAEEGFIEKLEAAVEEIAKEADEATEEIMRETKAAAEEFAGEAGAAAEEAKAAANDIVAKIKALVKDGNVTFIRIRKDDTVVLNLPMTVGIIGTVLGLAAAPWAIIIATISTIGLKCTVEVEKKDGTIITIHGKEKQ